MDSLVLCSALSPLKAHFEIMLIWLYSVKGAFWYGWLGGKSDKLNVSSCKKFLMKIEVPICGWCLCGQCVVSL